MGEYIFGVARKGFTSCFRFSKRIWKFSLTKDTQGDS